MRKLLALGLIVIVAVLYLYHQRLFLRDPLAKMYVGDTKVSAQVYINYSNDVLVLRDDAQPLLVQNWDNTPGTIKVLPCIRFMACWTEADQAAKFPLGVKAATMTNREVDFTDATGKPVRVVIR